MSSFRDQFKKQELDKRQELESLLSRKFELGPNFGKKFPCEQINSETGRTYRVEGKVSYPSITTVLGETKSPEAEAALQRWYDRVGQAEGERIRDRSGAYGTELHRKCELYVEGKADTSFLDDPLFVQVLPILKRMGKVLLSETSMYSHKLKVAGTTDNVAYFDNKRSIVDYKNGLRYKDEMYVQDYFDQVCAYAIMYNELFNENIEQIVIIMAVHGKPDAQVFIKQARECNGYVKSLKSRIEQYYSQRTQ